MIPFLKSFLRRRGINFCGVDHLGVDVEVDLQRLTASEPLRTIFDVGGNFGQSALRFSRAFPVARIFTFEPVPESFRKLEANIAGRRSITAFQHGFGDVAGSFQIQIQPNPGGNTLIGPCSSMGAVEIRLETLDSFVADHGIAQIDLLKIDVEGFELEVLKGASATLDRGAVRYIYAECVFAPDTIESHTDFFEMHRLLSQRGFSFVACYTESFRLSDGCALCNTLYAFKAKLPSAASGRIKNIY
jgi:FkbM family methyltransferase